MSNIEQAVQQHAPQIKHAADGLLAIFAMVLPAWINNVTTLVGLIGACGGVVLLGIRIYLGILEIRAKKSRLAVEKEFIER